MVGGCRTSNDAKTRDSADHLSAVAVLKGRCKLQRVADAENSLKVSCANVKDLNGQSVVGFASVDNSFDSFMCKAPLTPAGNFLQGTCLTDANDRAAIDRIINESHTKDISIQIRERGNDKQKPKGCLPTQVCLR